jgi:regenerating islet-derived protein 4
MVLKIFIFAIFLQHVLGNCPVGYIDSLDGSRCYKVMVGATNWFTAEKQCATLGGHLSSIGDVFTNKYLRGIAETAFGTDTTFWLGGIKWPDPINWIWSDYGNFSFVSWAPGRRKSKLVINV